MTDFTHVVCPKCWADNRVPTDRIDAAPHCGKCKALLFDGHAVELSTDNFDRFIGRNDVPVLIDFWAPWCSPCRMMAPAFEAAAARVEPRVRLAKVNTEAHPSLAQRFNVRSIPTLCMLHKGQEIGRKTGAMGTPEIVHWASSVESPA